MRAGRLRRSMVARSRVGTDGGARKKGSGRYAGKGGVELRSLMVRGRLLPDHLLLGRRRPRAFLVWNSETAAAG